MDINNIYTDFWQLLATHLSSDDIYSFSLTCKQANKACRRALIMKKMSYPMLYPFHLTFEQRSLIQNMEKHSDQKFKLIDGEVGAGKTMCSTSYGIRNYTDPESKIVMCGPPSLILMWWKTLIKYFGVEPAVLHSTNPKYSSKTSWDNKPKEKFILVSYLLLGKHRVDWFDDGNDLLIVDEAHHQVSMNVKCFKEVIGLSATTTKKSGASRGIRSLSVRLGTNIKTCTYKLSKNIISRKLPPVQYLSYNLKVSDTTNLNCREYIHYNKNGSYDFRYIADIAKRLTHPITEDLKIYHTAGFIMVGRKRFKVPLGNSRTYKNKKKEITKDNPTLSEKQIENEMLKHATFDINILGVNYPKYAQALAIVKWVIARREKVIIFDNSVTFLPFIHKMMVSNKISSYIFSTHYGVTGRQRQLTKFKEDANPCVLLSSVGMLGEGQNVTEANHVIFLTNCLDSNKYYQGIGRCWRYPQKKTVNVHLLFGGSFDRKIYEHACGTTNLKDADWSKEFQ